MTKKEKGLLAGIVVMALAFVTTQLNSFGIIDLTSFYEITDWDPTVLQGFTLAGPVGYLIARIGLDARKSTLTQKAALETYLTGLQTKAQEANTKEIAAMRSAVEENTATNKALLAIEAEKDKRFKELQATLDVETLKAKTEEL